jgi:hypothetical protein
LFFFFLVPSLSLLSLLSFALYSRSFASSFTASTITTTLLLLHVFLRRNLTSFVETRLEYVFDKRAMSSLCSSRCEMGDFQSNRLDCRQIDERQNEESRRLSYIQTRLNSFFTSSNFIFPVIQASMIHLPSIRFVVQCFLRA